MLKKMFLTAFLVLVVVSTSQANPLAEAIGKWIESPPGYGTVIDENYNALLVQSPLGKKCFFTLIPNKTFFREQDYVSFRVDKNKPEYFRVRTYERDSAIIAVPNQYVKQVMEGNELAIIHGERKFEFSLKNADDILYKIMTSEDSDL
jgi:poly(3-hydroxyalkanoate) synthetase